MSTKNHSAIDVADIILFKCNERGIKDVSNKKLQKLLYYTQAWSLVLNKERIFYDKIEAWVHGPAIKSVYMSYKPHGYDIITVTTLDEDKLAKFSRRELSVIDEVLDAYGKYNASYLEALSHSEKPWIKAREGLEPDIGTNSEITLESMSKYYSKLTA